MNAQRPDSVSHEVSCSKDADFSKDPILAPADNLAVNDSKVTAASSAGKGEDKAFDELCEKLQADNADITTVTIGDVNGAQALALSQALVTNTAVNKLVIDLTYLNQFAGTIFSLLDFLETCQQILTVELKGAVLTQPSVCTCVSVLVSVIAKNKETKELILSQKSASMFKHYASIKQKQKQQQLQEENKDDESSVPQSDSSVDPFKKLATTFSECKYLESLWFEYLDEDLLCGIMANIKSIPKLNCLTVVPRHYSVETFNSISLVLAESQSLQTIELHGCRLTAKRFQPLAAALDAETTSGSVVELSLHDCRFDKASELLLEGCTGIMKLIIGHNVRFATPVVENRLLKHSLAALDLKFWNLLKLESLLNAIAEAGTDAPYCQEITDAIPLEELTLTLTTQAEVETLKLAVPKLDGLVLLTIDLVPSISEAAEELLDACMANRFLETVVMDGDKFKLQTKKAVTKKIGASKSEAPSSPTTAAKESVEPTSPSESNSKTKKEKKEKKKKKKDGDDETKKAKKEEKKRKKEAAKAAAALLEAEAAAEAAAGAEAEAESQPDIQADAEGESRIEAESDAAESVTDE